MPSRLSFPSGLRRPCYGLFVLLLVLTGCGLDPQRDAVGSAPPSPDRWTAGGDMSAAVAKTWVDSFADAALEKLVRAALAENYDLKAAAARVDAARQLARIEGSPRWPQVSISPGYQRAQVRSSGFGSSEYGAFEILFNLDWELDVWGRIRAAQVAAERSADAVDADFAAARLSLAARTVQSWFELAEARMQAEVAEQSVKDRGVIVDLVQGRFLRGLTRGLDVRLARTDLADAEAQRARARNRVQIQTRLLEVLLGRYPAGRLQAAGLPQLPIALPVGLPASLLERRPDLTAAFRRVTAADARLESAVKALWPRITLTASGGTRSPALTELADPRAAAWNLAAGLLQPVFTGGRLRRQMDLEQATVTEALNTYKSTALRAFREVEQALAAEEWLRRQEQALREAVAQTAESQKLAVYAYQHGQIEILTLLDSYRGTLTAQSEHLAVRRQLLNNRIDLYLALGGAPL